ncbi:MAG: SDR family oxidoreductase [Acidobacteria bacterium]|nr:MAG: SDR family oxidoreductase [Acidobacteriota bacterium]
MTASNESSTISRALEGRTALITGASRGLGRAIATGFAAAGAKLVLIGRVRSNLESVAQELRDKGAEVHCFPYDLSKVEGIPELYEWITSAAGEVNILINVAGKNFRVPAIEFPLEEWRGVVDLNLTAPFVLSQCFARPLIREGKPGKIVNIASLMTAAARPMIPAYTASKGALGMLTKALAVEWAQYRINVNAVGPGYFKTELTRPLHQDPVFDKWVLERTPMKRWGEPGDLVGAVVFLSSSAADFITGQILYVDGGWLANV